MMMPALTPDFAQSFQLESCAVRGRLVRLQSSLDLILHQHAYPEAVGALLGEATVIAAALGASLKYEGVFTFQAKSDGAVRLLVVDVTNDGGLRAYAQFDTAAAAQVLPARLLGRGHLAFTVDQKSHTDRYQGIVELQGEALTEAVQHYFRQSEQLPTGLLAAIRQDAAGRWHGGCLMTQQMPREGGGGLAATDTSVADDWHRVMMLMGTVTAAELSDPGLAASELLYRLFHEEGVRVYDPQPFRHQCRCSLKRVEDMLRSFPRAEIEGLAVDGIVNVTCEFCNRSYVFDAAQRAALFGE